MKTSAAKEKAGGTNSLDSLEQEGWSVPVVSVLTTEDVSVSIWCVALVGMNVDKRVLLDALRLDKSLGLLLPAPAPWKGMSVLVKDKQCKLQARHRYLYQLGPDVVRHASAAPKKDIIRDAAKASILIEKKFVSSDVWQVVHTRARQTAGAWFQNRFGVSVLDIHAPTCREDCPESFQMVVCVSSVQDQRQVLCASGVDGVWIRCLCVSKLCP